jgi:hypothetical protein
MQQTISCYTKYTMSRYYYDCEISADQIILDPDLNIDKLGWGAGDYFRVTNINGRAMLVKVDSLSKLVRDIGKDIVDIF